MRVLELAPQVYVTGQLFEQDLKLIAKQDVRSIMDNRSDDEALRQPLAADLARVAEELGINYEDIKAVELRPGNSRIAHEDRA